MTSAEPLSRARPHKGLLAKIRVDTGNSQPVFPTPQCVREEQGLTAIKRGMLAIKYLKPDILKLSDKTFFKF